ILILLLVRWGREPAGLDPLLWGLPRPAEEQERQPKADPGQHGADQEGGLEALVQHDEWARALVRRQEVLGAGDCNSRGDGDAERSPDLGRSVAEPRGEAGLVLGDACERRDGGGHEGEADAGTDDKQPEKDVSEVAATYGDLREQQRPRADERHA